MNYGEIIEFIQKYKDDTDLGGAEDLYREIDWFASKRRLYILKNRGRIIGVAGFVVIESPEELVGKWPEDNPDGEYLWVAYVVLHPIIRNKGIMPEWVKTGLRWFPNLKYIVYLRKGKMKIMYIDRLLKKEVTNV